MSCRDHNVNGKKSIPSQSEILSLTDSVNYRGLVYDTPIQAPHTTLGCSSHSSPLLPLWPPAVNPSAARLPAAQPGCCLPHLRNLLTCFPRTKTGGVCAPESPPLSRPESQMVCFTPAGCGFSSRHLIPGLLPGRGQVARRGSSRVTGLNYRELRVDPFSGSSHNLKCRTPLIMARAAAEYADADRQECHAFRR
ncbi:hypothetical protein SKAU_G00028820 [Synaphobranchus kaupii]|uniref:Uncharacterized protein n=1 Tax=Synaphobranchus kaupii TaxID=118154 RepID=A0A9Q1GEM5_SYNKA|nr:hypothetical protein SKAU_G00028820 [Synaphobranchus kaupii]